MDSDHDLSLNHSAEKTVFPLSFRSHIRLLELWGKSQEAQESAVLAAAHAAKVSDDYHLALSATRDSLDIPPEAKISTDLIRGELVITDAADRHD